MRFFQKLSVLLVGLPFALLAVDVWLKHPSNHSASGTLFHVWIGAAALAANGLCMLLSRRFSPRRLAAFALFFLLLFACDRFNVLVPYETWLARGMPDWGTLQR